MTGFGLYPGVTGNGLIISFTPGLKLVLGANGLGKTTLITILYRLMTGPFDIPGLTTQGELGNVSLQPTALSGSARSVFAQRVNDGAKDGRATLVMSVGTKLIKIERRLKDMSLVLFSIDGIAKKPDEPTFQSEISKLVGVWSFGDWILLLRHMIFYFEDRRALVWDPSAQRQLLRFLLLPPEVAQIWTQSEREILELDSRMRNLRFAAFREEQALTQVETKARTGASVRVELNTLEDLQKSDLDARQKLDDVFVEMDRTRRSATLRFLKSQQERESLYRAYERAKLTAVEARFPSKSESARYILEQLFTEAECLVCGHHTPEAQATLEQRIADSRCVVCGSDLADHDHQSPGHRLADRRVKKAETDLHSFEPELAEATIQRDITEKAFNAATVELAELDLRIADRTARIDALVKRLPPAEAEIHKQRSELASMRSRVEGLVLELSSKRDAFRTFVARQSRDLVKRSDEIRTAFMKYAGGFLLESVQLIWSPQKARLGQTGEAIEFPAFELEMSGANFASPVRRTGPEQVSESQREFIDLAFRMALMSVASNSGHGSLVIDAPEASLDAIFVTRAADVLAKFASAAGGNQLTITSNLVEGQLIPELLIRSAPSGDRLSRVVNLFDIAEPTAAVRERRSDYDAVMQGLMAKVEPNTKAKPRAKAGRKK